jgi:hypothetical protein
VMEMLLGTSVCEGPLSLTPLMSCTLHAGGRQGRRTCGKADRCTSICTMYVKKYEFVSCRSSPILRGGGVAPTVHGRQAFLIIFLLTWHGIVSHGRAAQRRPGWKAEVPRKQTNGMAHWYGAVQFREAQSGRANQLYAR